MGDRKTLGAMGEDAAASYLARIGYRIVGRNVRPVPGMSRGELDIIAWESGVLVFVEVKTRRKAASRQGSVVESINYAKRRQLVSLANAYIGLNRLGEILCRFDVVFVLLKEEVPPQFHIVRNAFDSDL